MDGAKSSQLGRNWKWKVNGLKTLQKLEYFGHLKRSKGLEKIILEGKIDGKRERRRPRRCWKRDIRDVFDMSLTEGGRLATDKNCFTCTVRDVTSYEDKQLEK